MKTATTFQDLLTTAHRRGDEDELNTLLDLQSNVKAEVFARIDAANDAAANLAHQLHALQNLIDGAKEQGMDLSDGEAPLLKINVATVALQEWSER